MPINAETQALFLSMPNIPFAGLIHKETSEVVLAPCIPQKVRLVLNSAGEISSGTLIDDNFEATAELDRKALTDMKTLFEQRHLPRLLSISEWDERSAHELLFEQACSGTKKADWGGFAITRDNASDSLDYAFISGAFNSQKGKRTRKAILSDELIRTVKEETRHLVQNPRNIVVAAEDRTAEIEAETREAFDRNSTPPRDHARLSLKRDYQGCFFSDNPKKHEPAKNQSMRLDFN